MLAEPSDPNDGLVRILRDGNILWLGVEVSDASIGGSTGLWNLDGIIMSMVNREFRPDDFTATGDPNYFGGTSEGNVRSEFILGWHHPADTTETGGVVPGIGPRGFSSNFGVCFGCSMDDEHDTTAWDHRTTVNGVSNDDTHGADEGYVMELFIDLGRMGYDFSQAGGDKVPFSIALQDADYGWPNDPDNFFVSRVWFQHPYANNYNDGVGYIMGAPDVTVSSGAVPDVTEPEFTVADGSSFDEPVLDGALDDDVWESVEDMFFLQYQPELSVADANPGPLVPYYTFYFRPIGGDVVAVDRTVGRFKMFHRGSTLYIGLDTDDQAISGVVDENGRDGFRIVLRGLDTLTTRNTLAGLQFDFAIDSTGAIAYANYAAELQETAPGAVTGAVHIKGAGTVADPNDIDEGYQMEIAIDLAQAAGYSESLDEARIWILLNFFDGDYLDVPENSYATRVWMIGERAEGASLYGFLAGGGGTSIEDGVAGVPGEVRLLGNYPNPFASVTQVRYALPSAGQVTVEVFDVLGRRVARVEPGLQAAGPNSARIDAAGLAAGVYLYRVQVEGASTASATGRMLLVR